jgi:hypothetical protein
LSVDPGDLETAFFAKSDNDRRKAAERCFSDPILVIENGSEISHSFGAITPDEKKRTWKEPMVLNVRIQYQDLDGRVYHNYQPLRIRGEDRYPDPSWG